MEEESTAKFSLQLGGKAPQTSSDGQESEEGRRPGIHVPAPRPRLYFLKLIPFYGRAWVVPHGASQLMCPTPITPLGAFLTRKVFSGVSLTTLYIWHTQIHAKELTHAHVNRYTHLYLLYRANVTYNCNITIVIQVVILLTIIFVVQEKEDPHRQA